MKYSDWHNCCTANNPNVKLAALHLKTICPYWIKLPILFEQIYKSNPRHSNHYELANYRIETISKVNNFLKSLEYNTRV